MDVRTLLITSLVAWFVTVIGWLYNNHHSNKRESRKEVRACLDKLIDTVDEIVSASHLYYCSQAKDEQLTSEAEIYAKFEKIAGVFQRLENDFPSFKLMHLIDALYESITGGQFGSENLSRNSDSNMEILRKVGLSAEKVRTEVENWYTYSFEKT